MTANTAGKRRPARVAAIGGGVALAGALAYIGLADPHRPGFLFPPCQFHVATGFLCPGCGGLRMTHDVLNADFAAAVRDNVFLLVGLPLLLGWVLVRWRSGKRPFSMAVYVVVAVAAVAWTVARNLPGFPLVPSLLEG